jgi:ectoine hydroxylase-related dioxygenase (phytanoyl-CoA dioxygenase family)
MRWRRLRMDNWFNLITSTSELPGDTAQELDDSGFVVIPGLVENERLPHIADAYDSAVSCAAPADVSIGSSTTRVQDFVNRGPDFDDLYVSRPILAACCRIITRPFKLSTMHARTVNPNSPVQALHVDFPREAEAWPMVDFIIMVDEFRKDNGATRFVPGSHNWSTLPSALKKDPAADDGRQVLACGPAGSVIVYNGSVWHGHSANQTSEPRRSIQGAYIRRDAVSGVNQAERIRPETLGRIGLLAKYLLAV